MSAESETTRPTRRKHELASLYKYTTANTAKIMLRTAARRWSSPLIFNDPFDVTQELRLDYSAAELNHAFAVEFAELIKGGHDGTGVRDLRIKAMLGLVHRVADESARRELAAELLKPEDPTVAQIEAFRKIQEEWARAVPTMRILCLSERRDATAMWNHYADEYKGVVLEFACSDELDSPLLVAKPVQYQDGPPAVAEVGEWARCSLGLTEHNIWDLFSECQYIKTTDWQYEREWRIATYARADEEGLYSDWLFHPGELLSVCFGEACTVEDRGEIASLLEHQYPHATASNAVRNNLAARFEFNPV